jgi:hypothetical protein
MVQQVDAAAAAVNSDDGIRHAGTTAAEVGAGATDCVGCRPGSHKAHTCGKARPRGGCKRPALQALTRNLDFDHPGRRMRRNSCNMCLDKDQQLAQKDEIIAELKRERNEAQRLVALYEEDYEGGDYEDYENEEYENEEYEGEDQVAIVREGALGPLIALLSEGSAGAQEQAALALGTLAFNNAENQVAIVQAGALGPLVALLSEGSAAAREQAARAMTNLAANENNDSAFASAGALGALIALLSEGSAGAREAAAGALENLMFDAGTRAEAAKLGYVRPS